MWEGMPGFAGVQYRGGGCSLEDCTHQSHSEVRVGKRRRGVRQVRRRPLLRGGGRRETMNSRKDPGGCRDASSGNPGIWRRRPRPLGGPALPRQGLLLKATHAPGQEALSEIRPPARQSPEPALRTWLRRSGILPRRRLRRPLPIPSLPGPAPYPAVTGRHHGQSQPYPCGSEPNPRLLKAGLLQSHPDSSWGRKIPFVWESRAVIELASLPGGSALFWSSGFWVCSGLRPYPATFQDLGTPCGGLIGGLSKL